MMGKAAATSVNAYLAAQPSRARKALKLVRQAIRAAVPQAEESISYTIPAYKINGKPVLFFAGWKEHYSLYPATDGVQRAFAKDLEKHDLKARTMRFDLAKPVPARLIARIARFRAKELAALIKTKPKK